MEQISATIDRYFWSKLVQPLREINATKERESVSTGSNEACHIIELMKSNEKDCHIMGTDERDCQIYRTNEKGCNIHEEIVYFSRNQHNIHGTPMKQIVKFMAHRR
jgi:hypothetical protein